MNLCTVEIEVMSPDGSPIENAMVTATLNKTIFDNEVVVPAQVVSKTDDKGHGSFSLWPTESQPNEHAQYRITIETPDRLLESFTVSVPQLSTSKLSELPRVNSSMPDELLQIKQYIEKADLNIIKGPTSENLDTLWLVRQEKNSRGDATGNFILVPSTIENYIPDIPTDADFATTTIRSFLDLYGNAHLYGHLTVGKVLNVLDSLVLGNDTKLDDTPITILRGSSLDQDKWGGLNLGVYENGEYAVIGYYNSDKEYFGLYFNESGLHIKKGGGPVESFLTNTVNDVEDKAATPKAVNSIKTIAQQAKKIATSLSNTIAADIQSSKSSALEAHTDAQLAHQSELSVTASKQHIDQLYTQVETTARTVDRQHREVATNLAEISSDHTDIMSAKREILSAKTNIMNAIASTFKDGGTWTPTAQKEYPDKPNPAHSTSWFVVLPKGQTYTFTSGDLQNDDHNIVEHGSMLYYSAVENKFHGGGDGSLAVGEIVLPNGTKRGHSITITLADLGAWSGRGGFDGDVVLGEHALYANDGAIAIKDDDTTHQGLQVGDASAAGQQTFIHSVGNIKAIFQGVAGEFDVYTSHNLPSLKDISKADRVAIGEEAGKASQSYGSVAVGQYAGSDTQGTYAVGIGRSAGGNHQGSSSVAIGFGAGKVNQRPNAVAIGANSGQLDQPEKSTAIGFGANAVQANGISIGSANSTVKIGDGHIQSVSDRRDKIDIDYNGVHGLDFIMKLNTCTYRYDLRELYYEYNEDGSITKHPHDGSKAGKRHHQGLIAQDVKAVADELGFDFSGYRDERISATDEHKDDADKKALVYTSFIPTLIKAVQEQQNQIEDLKKQLGLYKRSN